MFDPEKFGKAMGNMVRETVAPLWKRIEELEAREPIHGKDGIDGKDGRDGVDGKDGAPGEKGFDGINGNDGKDGIDGKDGRDGVDGKDGAPGEKGFDGINGNDGKDGIDGKDGQNGADGADGAQGIQGEKGEKGDPGEPGRDGANGKDGVDGKSITLEDVSSHLETAVNKWALEFERRAQDILQKAIDKIPTPKDGADGKDGRDGVGFDDLEVEYDGKKTVSFRLIRDDVCKEFDLVLPIVMDQGTFKHDAKYLAGDGVTYGGCFWIAQKDEPGKPGDGDGWRLAVKKGRDGKDGRNGIDKTAAVTV